MTRRAINIAASAIVAMTILVAGPAGAVGDPAAATSFDGCRYLLPADVARAAGVANVQRKTQGALPPEAFEAATCAYEQTAGVSTFFDTNLTVFTRASVIAMGYPATEFQDDGLFVLDAGSVAAPNQPGTPVAGVGDAASLYTNSGIAQLFVRSGGVRMALEGSGPLGNQASLVTLARGVLQHLAQEPPAPTPSVAPNSFKPVAVTGPFGNGRAMLQAPGYANIYNGSFGPYEIRDGKITTEVDPLPRTPPEVQLRGFALGHGRRGLIAVLQFAAPITIANQYPDAAIDQRIGVTFRSPAGKATTIEIGPDGKGSTVAGDDVTASSRGPAATAYTGNVAVLIAPPALGVGEDWTATAWARVVATGGRLQGRQGLQGWQSATPPAVVSALDGKAGKTLAFTPVPASPGAVDGRDPLALPRSLQVVSTTLSGRGPSAELDVRFAAPPNMPATLNGKPQASFTLTFRLVPPGWQNTPMLVTYRLNPSAAPLQQTAGVTGGGRGGNVPVRIDGDVLHIAIGKFTANPVNPTPTTSLPGAQRSLTLGAIDSTYSIFPTIAPDACICPGGEPAGFRLPASALASGPLTERLTMHLSGDAIAITRVSTGTTAVGSIDPTSSEFVATNAHEMWAGMLVSGGIEATYTFGLDQFSHLAPHAAGSTVGAAFNSSAAVAIEPVSGGGTFLYGDLPGAATGSGQPGGGAPSPAAGSPCPEARYKVIFSGGRWVTTRVDAPFRLPNASEGFDQLADETNWDYGRRVAAGWRPASCAPQSVATSATGAVPVAPIPLATVAPTAQPASAGTVTGASLVPGDIAANWWICGDVSIQAGTADLAVAHSQTPCVQASMLGNFPSRSGKSIGTVGGSNVAGTLPGVSAKHGGGGGANGLIIGIIVLIVAAAGIFGLRMRNAHRTPGSTDPE
ncbi:MAG: hypothetical protein JWL83_1206 [Actinomycetia bacterium]|nr:hypothetical protein [Actinomycetes bacterium]